MSGSWYVFLYTAKGYKYLHPIFKRRNLRVLTHVELKMQRMRQADICSASSAVEVACQDGEHEESSWEQSLTLSHFIVAATSPFACIVSRLCVTSEDCFISWH